MGAMGRGALFATSVAASLLLVAGVVLGFVASGRAETGTAQDSTKSAMLELLEPVEFTNEGLRDLPIVSPGGAVATQFPGGVGVDDPYQVDSAIDGLLAEIGLDGVGQDFYLAGAVKDEINQLSQPLVNDPPILPTYPYVYSSLDSMVSSAALDPEKVVDIAALAFFSSAYGGDENQGCLDFCRVPSEALALALLQAVQADQPTCDAQTALTYLVSLGQNVPLSAVEQEARRGVELCPGDPTPLWILAQTAAEQGTVVKYLQVVEGTTANARKVAHEVFAELRAEFPDSPLGWAGEADFLLDRADEAAGFAIAPFQVEAWRRTALTDYEEARHRSGNVGLLAGHARALSAVGRDDDAADVAATLVELEPAYAPYQAIQTSVHSAMNDFKGVLEARAAAPDPELPRLDAFSVGNLRGFSTRGGAASDWPYDPAYNPAGGAGVTDTSFLPPLGDGIDYEGCVGQAELAALVATGQAAEAVDLMHSPAFGPGFGTSLQCDFVPYEEPYEDYTFSPGLLELVVIGEAGDADALATYMENYVGWPVGYPYEKRLEFWWQLGDADASRDVINEWVSALPDDAFGHASLGELEFAEEHFDEAVTAFSDAIDLVPLLDQESGSLPLHGAEGDPEEVLQQLYLQRGKTYELAGDKGRARADYEKVEEIQAGRDYGGWWGGYGSAQLGVMALYDGDFPEAEELLQAAISTRIGDGLSLASKGEVFPDTGLIFRGAEHNNLALAAAKAGDLEVAAEAAREAVLRDPINPVFLDTQAFVAQLSGDTDEAVDAYRDALAQDSTSYVSANNLAVLLADDGDEDRAKRLLELAVAAQPSYAKAWHNLGVLQMRGGGVGDYLDGQGALARAAGLDHELRGDDTSLLADEQIYDSGLDVSKAVPADWSYAESASSPDRGLLITMLLLILLRAGWLFGLDRASGWLTEKVIASSPRASGRVGWFWRRLNVRWALAASFLVLAVPLVWGRGLFGSLVLSALVLGIVAVPMLVRLLVLRRREVAMFGWTPALAVGLMGIPFGVSVVPYPSLDDDQNVRWRLRWMPVLVLASVLALLLLATLLTDVPFLRSSAAASLALVGTMLLPVPPFDGAHLTSRRWGAVAAAGLTVGALAFGLNWI